MIDLRSDTVTKPTEEMREAMYRAEVGDDVSGEDPTVNELEALAADMLGKEAALFVPSGTFGNQLSIFTHTHRGDEVVISNDAHPVQHEVGAAAVISGVTLRTVRTDRQWFSWSEIVDYLRLEEDIHFPRTGLIEVQNSLSNGDVWPLEEMSEIYENAKKYGIPVHLDGARIFNAAVYLGVEVSEIAKYADSVMFCLSKGLASPVGSMLAGTKDFIARARKGRKLMGGGMRQVGILAAAGIVSLTKMTKRLAEDHKNAKRLAEAFASFSDVFDVDLSKVKTNMLFVRLKKGGVDFNAILEKYGIRTYPPEFGEYRFVTHKDVKSEDIDFIIENLPLIVSEIK